MSDPFDRIQKLSDTATRERLRELRTQLADCLARMDELGLWDVSQHMDMALARFDENYPVEAFERAAEKDEQERRRRSH
ncbi:MAG: hypothetical protein WDN31_02405 [Hyphomicrobium sp.]